MPVPSLNYRPNGGDPRSIADLLGDFDQIVSAIGAIDNSMISASAAIALSKLGQSGAASGQVPTWNGSAWVPSTPDPAAFSLSAVTDVGTGSATAETDLQSVTIPAGSLSAGDVVRIMAGLTWSGSAGARTANLYFTDGGGTAIASVVLAGASGSLSFIATVVVGASATTFQAVTYAEATIIADPIADSINTANAITVKTTGTTSDPSDEITSKVLAVDVIPASS